jgi:hypothetical protein
MKGPMATLKKTFERLKLERVNKWPNFLMLDDDGDFLLDVFFISFISVPVS